MTIYDFKVKNSANEEISLTTYKNKVVLIVNTASKCGLTPQFDALQKLYEELGNDKFEILGFPCNQFANQEPGRNDEIVNFCSLNYGISFPIMDKIKVNGENTHPLYKYLKDESKGFVNKSIKWNFTKFLIDSNGKVFKRYSPTTIPNNIKSDIVNLIDKI
ncbi:MAG: glutathione peroxidase [Clostridiales bacterium]